jgi:hypothetical protein
MAIKSQKDLAAGLMFMVVGVGFALVARNYAMGTAAQMGPSYFPTILGAILAGLGIIIALRSFGKPDPDEMIGVIAWRPLALIIGANLLFGILLGGVPALGLPPLGLVLSIFVLVIVACLAGSEFRLREALILAVILIVGSYLVFMKLVNLPLNLWPAFFSG